MWQPPSEPSKRKTLVFPLSFIPGPSVSAAHAPFLFYQCDASPLANQHDSEWANDFQREGKSLSSDRRLVEFYAPSVIRYCVQFGRRKPMVQNQWNDTEMSSEDVKLKPEFRPFKAFFFFFFFFFLARFAQDGIVVLLFKAGRYHKV